MFTRGFRLFFRTVCTLRVTLILWPRLIPWTRRTLWMRIAFLPTRILTGRILARCILVGSVIRRARNVVARCRIITLAALGSRGIVSRSRDRVIWARHGCGSIWSARSVVRFTRGSGGYDAVAAEIARSRRRCDRWASMVYGSQQRSVRTGGPFMLSLHGGRFDVMVPACSLFFGQGASRHSTRAAVIANLVYRHVVDDRFVVHVHVRDVHVRYAAVIAKVSVVPTTAFVAMADISEPVVDPSIEADVRAPVARVPGVEAAAPSPIARGPEKANLGCHHPCTRNPVIAFVPVRPITGCPDVTIAGTKRLRVHRQGGWGNRDRDENSRKRCGGDCHQDDCEYQRPNGTGHLHSLSSCLVILRFPGLAFRLRVARTEGHRMFSLA